jgi:plastocyanin
VADGSAPRNLLWVNIIVGAIVLVVSVLESSMTLFVPMLIAGAVLVVAAGYASWAAQRLSQRARGGLAALCAVVGLGVAFLWLVSSENLSLRALFILLGAVSLVLSAWYSRKVLTAPAESAASPARSMRWLTWTLVVIIALGVIYGGFVAFASNSNGTDVTVVLDLGTNHDPGAATSMYLRCDGANSTAGVCSGGDQATVTVHQRDRIHLTIHNDDGGDHTHDFNVQGWQYALPPISPEMELHTQDQSWTFTAWASGSFKMLCEVPGHDAAGMHGLLVVS